MKKNIMFNIALLFGILLIVSCDEKEFLEEKPLSFYTPENSLEKSGDFQNAVNYLYNRERHLLWGGILADAQMALRYATDFAFNATDYDPAKKLNDYENTMVPTFNVPAVIWEINYEIISNANVIIDRARIADKLSDAEKKDYTSQALFIRALSYRMLAHLFGGVPLITEEVVVPKRDYVRATRNEVYNQCKEDLIKAIADLKDIDIVKDGKINKQVARHLLAEIYICLDMKNEAIAAASEVINDPRVSLMRERFGRRQSKPGDVYRDLFELNNQNRSTANNTEGLLVIQADYLNPASTQRDNAQWAMSPNMEGLTIKLTIDGIVKTYPATLGPNTKLSGRGIGWIRPTPHVLYTIWKDDFSGDIRNSQYNIVRDFQIDGVPSTSSAYGKWYVADGYKQNPSSWKDTIRNWYPIIKKNTYSEDDFPVDYYKKDASGNFEVSPFNGNTLIKASEAPFKDQYLFRLAETYLLRAEAYIKNGQPQKAADDLNVLRARANTFPVNAADVNIDFLLDERLRELYGEEYRMLTLTRMGLLYERNVKYNEKSGLTIKPYHNLWPIPYSEIERNIGAVLEQNPGYK